MSRLVLETAISPVLPLLLGKLRAARWDSTGATAEGTQDPAPHRAAGQGLATSRWRGSAPHNRGEPGPTLAAARILGRPADPAVPPEAQRAGGFRGQAIGPSEAGTGPTSSDCSEPCAEGRSSGGSVFDVACSSRQPLGGLTVVPSILIGMGARAPRERPGA